MRIVLAVVIPLMAAVLQGSSSASLAVGGARPSFPLLVAGSWSVAVGAREAVWWAFIGGLAADLLSGGPLGAQALASLPAVVAVGVGERPLLRPVAVLPGAALVGICALAGAVSYVAVLALIGQPLPSPVNLVVDALGGALYTSLLALVVYPVFRLLRRASEKQSSAG